MSLVLRKPDICICTTDQHLCFFTTWIAQLLFFLNPKFRASSHLLLLYSIVCVGLQDRRLVFIVERFFISKNKLVSFKKGNQYLEHQNVEIARKWFIGKYRPLLVLFFNYHHPADILVCFLHSTNYHNIGDKTCFVSLNNFELQTNIDPQVRQINECAKTGCFSIVVRNRALFKASNE